MQTSAATLMMIMTMKKNSDSNQSNSSFKMLQNSLINTGDGSSSSASSSSSSASNEHKTNVEEEDLEDEVYFASGPFYAQLDDVDDYDEEGDDNLKALHHRNAVNSRHQVEQSTRPHHPQNGFHNKSCNVLYAEMPRTSAAQLSSMTMTTGGDRQNKSTLTSNNSSSTSSSSALSMAKAITATFKTQQQQQQNTTNNKPVTNKLHHCICRSKLKNLLLFGGAASHHQQNSLCSNECPSRVTLNQKPPAKKITKIMVNSSKTTQEASSADNLLFPLVSKSSISKKDFSQFSHSGGGGSASDFSSNSSSRTSSSGANSPINNSGNSTAESEFKGIFHSNVTFLKCNNYSKKNSQNLESSRKVVYCCTTTTEDDNDKQTINNSCICVIKPTAIRPATSISFYPEKNILSEDEEDEDMSDMVYRRRSLASRLSRREVEEEIVDNKNTLSLLGNYQDTASTVDTPLALKSSAFHQPTATMANARRRRSSLHVRSSSLSDYYSYEDGIDSAPLECNPSTSSAVRYPSVIPGGCCSITEPNTATSTPQRRNDTLITIKNIQTKTEPNLSSTNEPIHMTLEEVRRIAFGSDPSTNEPVVPNNPNPSSLSIASNHLQHLNCDKSRNVSQPTTSTSPAVTLVTAPVTTNSQGNSSNSGTTKSKIKLAIENIFNKTHCIGSNNHHGGSATTLNSSGTSGHKGTIYKLNQNCCKSQLSTPSGGDSQLHHHHHHNLMSFIPNGYRRINIEDEQQSLKTVNKNAGKALKAPAPPLLEDASTADSVNNPSSSPFIRRALPPLPPPAPSSLTATNSPPDVPLLRPQSSTESSSLVRSISPMAALPLPPPPAPPPLPPNPSPSNLFRLPTNYLTSSIGTIGELSAISDSSKVISDEEDRRKFLDYAASIERVKDCGWYWGPISGEMAEKLLETEPCGSFIVRDSSDEHYIFSLTFKLNGMVRHVRIEHDQGNFSFGSLQKFRSNTIVDFIENAVEHSRSGRFLFFLHRRPVMGPLRVQLLHPVSRFKRVQSLQHNCRFVVLKHVRRDQIDQLPLPDYMKHYLDTPYYYSEELANLQDSMEHEKSRKQLKEMKRNFFLQTSLKNLVSKMLIDKTEIEQGLKVKLQIRPDDLESKPSTSHSAPGDDSTTDVNIVDNSDIIEAIDGNGDPTIQEEEELSPILPEPENPPLQPDNLNNNNNNRIDVPEYGESEFDEDHLVIEI